MVFVDRRSVYAGVDSESRNTSSDAQVHGSYVRPLEQPARQANQKWQALRHHAGGHAVFVYRSPAASWLRPEGLNTQTLVHLCRSMITLRSKCRGATRCQLNELAPVWSRFLVIQSSAVLGHDSLRVHRDAVPA